MAGVTLARRVEEFLQTISGSGYGDGYGDGSGYGYGYGDCSGYGDGYGDGSGSGYGYGSGYSSGYGDGVTRFDGQEVHDIDGVQTIITSVKGNVARGYTLGADLTLTKCYVAKVGDFFAHGETAEDAVRDAQAKAFQELGEEERIAAFWQEFEQGKEYPARLFFDWHGRLTGSCEHGRRQFVQDRGIDLESMMTVSQFVETVRGAYGWDVVKALEDKE